MRRCDGKVEKNERDDEQATNLSVRYAYESKKR